MRLSELYPSVQGEGPNVGKPMQFVRFGGCNMRCPGWPCDTEYAINPDYRNQWAQISPEDLNKRIADYPPHVCITGGEPLIQRKEEMNALLETLITRRGFSVDLFTNGSQPLPDVRRSHALAMTVVMDWKLPGSGEEYTGIVQRKENVEELQRWDAIKFVVKDGIDLHAAKRVYEEQLHRTACKWYVGRVWGEELTDDEIVAFVLSNKLPWALNLQTHKMIWPDAVRGV